MRVFASNLRSNGYFASLVAILLLLSDTGHSEDLVTNSASESGTPHVSGYRARIDPPKEYSPEHPLIPVLKYARDVQAYLARSVKNFSCRLTKRERIDGELQEYYFIDMQVEEASHADDGSRRPMRVFLKFLGPPEAAGRKVIFVEGENNGKMLVRKGGKRFSYAVVKIDPLSENAQRESLLPINDVGFGSLLNHEISVLESHAQIDPTGSNTHVQHSGDSKINGRPCEVIRITHPKQQTGLQFHIANVYVDKALHVPVRIDASGWPDQPGQSPPLLAEYTYTDLRLNVDMPEATFDPDTLKK